MQPLIANLTKDSLSGLTEHLENRSDMGTFSEDEDLYLVEHPQKVALSSGGTPTPAGTSMLTI